MEEPANDAAKHGSLTRKFEFGNIGSEVSGDEKSSRDLMSQENGGIHEFRGNYDIESPHFIFNDNDSNLSPKHLRAVKVNAVTQTYKLMLANHSSQTDFDIKNCLIHYRYKPVGQLIQQGDEEFEEIDDLLGYESSVIESKLGRSTVAESRYKLDYSQRYNPDDDVEQQKMAEGNTLTSSKRSNSIVKARKKVPSKENTNCATNCTI